MRFPMFFFFLGGGRGEGGGIERDQWHKMG